MEWIRYKSFGVEENPHPKPGTCPSTVLGDPNLRFGFAQEPATPVASIHPGEAGTLSHLALFFETWNLQPGTCNLVLEIPNFPLLILPEIFWDWCRICNLGHGLRNSAYEEITVVFHVAP